MGNGNGTRRAGNFAEEQHDGQERGDQTRKFAADSHDDTTKECVYSDGVGHVYSEASVRRARDEKYPAVSEWITNNDAAFRWLESAFLELAEIATGAEIGGNLLCYHLRYVGVLSADGSRKRRKVSITNDANPVLARLLAALHPEQADKLRMRPCVWDVDALRPLLDELAEMVEAR